MMANQTDNTSLNILLIGKTGHGKSATGNSILGRRAFETSSGVSSETKEVTDAWTVDGLNEIHVIDGPGLASTGLDKAQNMKQACENMAKALMLCNGGVHAFVLVIKFGIRFTEEERRTISDLTQIFGKNYLKDHGIIVFTGGDHFADHMEDEETPNKTFSEWCDQQDKDFRNLLQECNSRIVMFNNRPKCQEEEITRQRNELLSHAQELRQKRGLYTNEHFQVFAQVREKMVLDWELAIFRDKLQKRIGLLSAELEQMSFNSSLTDVDRLDARIKDVHMEIGEEGQKKKTMKPLIDSLRKLSNTTKDIRRAIKEKNVEDLQLHLKKLPLCKEELNRASRIPSGDILIGLGLVLAGGAIALVAPEGVAAVIAGRVLLGIGSVAATLLGAAYKFLNNQQRQL